MINMGIWLIRLYKSMKKASKSLFINNKHKSDNIQNVIKQVSEKVNPSILENLIDTKQFNIIKPLSESFSNIYKKFEANKPEYINSFNKYLKELKEASKPQFENNNDYLHHIKNTISEVKKITSDEPMYDNLLEAIIEEDELEEQPAYAGTREDYDVPSLEKIGSGTGNQIHGWGLYYAKWKRTAYDYYNRFVHNDENYVYNNEILPTELFDILDIYTFEDICDNKISKEQVLEKMKLHYEYIKDTNSDNEKYLQSLEEKYKKWTDFIKNSDFSKFELRSRNGQIHMVDLPEDEFLIDEDKRFSDQSEYVRNILLKISNENEEYRLLKKAIKDNDYGDVLYKNFGKDSFYNSNGYEGGSTETKKFASQCLDKYGIKGIKYYDKGDGDCFVIFNPNNVKIIDKLIKEAEEIEEQPAYAGSKVDYDVPSLDAIGSGEGHAAHGWGLYYAQSKDVATSYYKKFTSNNIEIEYEGQIFKYDSDDAFEDRLYKSLMNIFQSDNKEETKQQEIKQIKFFIKYNEHNNQNNENTLIYKKILDFLNNVDVSKIKVKGQIHQVELPEDEYLLDEQKSFKEQSDYVKKALENIEQALIKPNFHQKIFDNKEEANEFFDFKIDEFEEKANGYQRFFPEYFQTEDGKYGVKFVDNYTVYQKLIGENFDITGETIYKKIAYQLGSYKDASEFLNIFGIKGITYYGRQDGDCFVIFNPDNVKIIDKLIKEAEEIEEQPAYCGASKPFDKADPKLIGKGHNLFQHGFGFYFTTDKESADYYRRGHTLDGKTGGAIMTVELPEDKYFINEDNEEQSEYVYKRLVKLYNSKILSKEVVERNKKYNLDPISGTGREIYEEIADSVGGSKKASELLAKFGIKGITYFSRTDGKCFVIFSPDDIKVIEKQDFSIKESKIQDKTDNQVQVDGQWYHQRVIDNYLGDGTFDKLNIGDDIDLGKKEQPKQPNQKSEYILNNNFWAWFGDSKVRDEEGNPLVVYHGSEYDISKFIKDYSGATTGNNYAECFYFTSNKDSAIDYSIEATVRSHESEFYDEDWCNELSYDDYNANIRNKVGENPHINPCFLKMENPYIYDNQYKEFDYMKIYTMEMVLQGRGDEHQLFDEDTYYEMLDALGYYDEDGEFHEDGRQYDGLIIKNVVDDIGDFHGTIDEYIVWNPNQIKSVNNKGNWSLYSDNVNEALTESAELNDNFWKWFNGSKVVNNDGTPKIVYHGTKDKFTVFKQGFGKKYDSGYAGTGFYFSDSKNTAQNYADWKNGKNNPTVMPVYLNIKNPLFLNPKGAGVKPTVQKALGLDVDYYPCGMTKELSDLITKTAQEKGYDGIIYDSIDNNKVFVVFEPNQIKSVNNNGNWSASSDDINEEQEVINERLFPEISDDVYNELINITAPENHKANSYTKWLGNYIKNHRWEGDKDRIRTMLDRHKKLFADNKVKPIMDYNNLDDLFDDLSKWENYLTKSEKSKFASKGAIKLATIDGYTIYDIQSRDAARKYGENTKWCVTDSTSDFYFNKYTREMSDELGSKSESKLLYIIGNGRKFAASYKFNIHNGRKNNSNTWCQKWLDIFNSLDGLEYHYNIIQYENEQPNIEESGDKEPIASVINWIMDNYGINKESIESELKSIISEQVAYQGSSHDFDKHSTEFIGKGTGFSEYGWGLYFTNSEQEAKDYKGMALGKTSAYYKGQPIKQFGYVVGDKSAKELPEWNVNLENLLNRVYRNGSSFKQDLTNLFDNYMEKLRHLEKGSECYNNCLKDMQDITDQLEFGKDITFGKGVLYKVEIPDDEYLLNGEDGGQSSTVWKALYKMKVDKIITDKSFKQMNKRGIDIYWDLVDTYKNKNKKLSQTEADKNASLKMLEYGIKGIKFASPYQGKKVINYCIFSADDVKILNKDLSEQINESAEHNITLYHASDSKFDNFDINYANTKAHKEKMKGIWLSNSRKYIKQFGKIIYTCKVDNSNILNIDSDKYDKIINHFEKKYNIPFDLEGDNANKAQKYLIDNGYTGIYFEKEKGVYVYVIFDANIIKIIGNKQLSEAVSYDNLNESIYHATMLKDGTMFEVHQNPTKKEFWELLNRSEAKDLRGILGINEPILYVWDSYYGTHKQVFDSIIGKDWKEEDYVGCWFRKDDMGVFGFSKFTSDIKEKYYGKEPEKPMSKDNLDKIIADDDLGLLREEYDWFEGEYEVLLNPDSSNEIRKFIKGDNYRILVNPIKNKIAIWDGWKGPLHDDIRKAYNFGKNNYILYITNKKLSLFEDELTTKLIASIDYENRKYPQFYPSLDDYIKEANEISNTQIIQKLFPNNTLVNDLLNIISRYKEKEKEYIEYYNKLDKQQEEFNKKWEKYNQETLEKEHGQINEDLEGYNRIAGFYWFDDGHWEMLKRKPEGVEELDPEDDVMDYCHLDDQGLEEDNKARFGIQRMDNKIVCYIQAVTKQKCLQAKKAIDKKFSDILIDKYEIEWYNPKTNRNEFEYLDEAYVQVDKPIGNTGMTYNADYIEFEPEMRFIDEYDVEWEVEQVKGDKVLLRTKNNQVRVDTAENLNLDIFALDKLKPVFDERFYTQSDLERE